VKIQRNVYDYLSGKRRKVDDLNSLRFYDSQNNHHIEIRVTANKKGEEVWSGRIITGYEAGQQKLARLRALRDAGIPNARALRKLPKREREKNRNTLREIENTYPIVDRADKLNQGRFIMSLAEGETLFMRHKHTDEVSYFVVAKLVKPQRIVVVPHWDARPATERKDFEGKKVQDSKRDQFDLTPSDLKSLAPPGYPHVVKVHVTMLGRTTSLIKH
jgi:hypothetical protein